jgi:hypothetical protein
MMAIQLTVFVFNFPAKLFEELKVRRKPEVYLSTLYFCLLIITPITELMLLLIIAAAIIS